MAVKTNRGGGNGGLFVVLGLGAVALYFFTRPQVTTGTTANPITLPGYGPIAVNSSTGPTLPQGPDTQGQQLIYGPTLQQLGAPANAADASVTTGGEFSTNV